MPNDTVQVTCTVSNNGDSISTSPPSLNLTGKTQPCTIQFNLQPSNGNYSWETTSPFGIEVTSGNGEFTNYNRVDNDTVTVVDANTGGGSYVYTVSCNGPDGTVVGDPTIVNRR